MFPTHRSVVDLRPPPADARLDVSEMNPQRSVSAASAPAHVSGAAFASASAVSGAGAQIAPAVTTRAALSDAGAAAAGSAAAAAEWLAPLHADPLGIVAAYLPSEDQLHFRALSTVARIETDRKVETLTLSLRDAAVLFGNTTGFSHLQRLEISDPDVTWEAFRTFADRLEATPHAPFELVLSTSVQVGLGNILDRLGKMKLSSLTLLKSAITRVEARGLAGANYPISIALGYASDPVRVSLIAHIPTLTSLSLNYDYHLSNEDALAVRSHGFLTGFKAREISSAQLLNVLANPRMTSLRFEKIFGWNDEVGAALASHPGMTSLDPGYLVPAEQLRRILGATHIVSLKLDPIALRGSDRPQLGEMHSLRDFTLFRSSNICVDSAHIADLCRKPLDSLRFDRAVMTPRALESAAGAHAQRLSFHHVSTFTPTRGTLAEIDFVFRAEGACGARRYVFTQAAVDAVVANRHVTSLSLLGGLVEGGAALLAAGPGLQQLSLTTSSASETVESVQRAWVAAGKSLVDLTVSIDPSLAASESFTVWESE